MACGWKRASFTVEASFLMPVLCVLLVLFFQASMYLHDMSAFVAIACEVAMKGGEWEKGSREEQKLYVETVARERMAETELLDWNCSVEVSITSTEVEVGIKGVSSAFNLFRVDVKKKAYYTNEVDELRMWKKKQKIGME